METAEQIPTKIKLIQTFWKFFEAFCENSTIPGVRYIVERGRHWSERFERLNFAFDIYIHIPVISIVNTFK